MVTWDYSPLSGLVHVDGSHLIELPKGRPVVLCGGAADLTENLSDEVAPGYCWQENDALAIARDESFVIWIAVKLALLDHKLLRFRPAVARIDYHHSIHAVCDMRNHWRCAAVIHIGARHIRLEVVAEIGFARNRCEVLVRR